MGGVGITYNDVKMAVATCQGQQKNPTVDNIRNVLGTGSRSTIAKYLREWKSKNQITNADEAGLPHELLQLVRGLWEKLSDDADQAILKYKDEANAKIDEAQKAYLQKQQTYTLLQSNYHDLEEKSHQQNEQITQLQKQLTDAQHDAMKQAERSASLESQSKENKIENERLHQLLKNVQDNLVHYQKATQELCQEQTLLLEKQRNEYEKKISSYQVQSDTLKNQTVQLQSQNTQLMKTNDTLTSEHNTLKHQDAELSKAHDTLTATHNQLQQSYDRLTQQFNNQLKSLESKTDELIELKIQIKSTENKLSDCEKSLSNADNKTHTLRHELDIARQEKAHLEGQIQQLQSVLTAKRKRVSV